MGGSLMRCEDELIPDRLMNDFESHQHMSLSEQDVRRIALLARLELTDAEVHRLTPQLDAIVGFVEKLGDLDTAGVEPLTQAMETRNRLADDVPRPCLSRELALSNAPKQDGECYLVPPVL